MARRYAESTYQCGRYQAAGWDVMCEPAEGWAPETKQSNTWTPAADEGGTWTPEPPQIDWTPQ